MFINDIMFLDKAIEYLILDKFIDYWYVFIKNTLLIWCEAHIWRIVTILQLKEMRILTRFEASSD